MGPDHVGPCRSWEGFWAFILPQGEATGGFQTEEWRGPSYSFGSAFWLLYGKWGRRTKGSRGPVRRLWHVSK